MIAPAPAVLRIHWTNEAQKKRAADALGIGKVRMMRRFRVASDVAQRIQSAAVAATGHTVGELLANGNGAVTVEHDQSLPKGAIIEDEPCACLP